MNEQDMTPETAERGRELAQQLISAVAYDDHESVDRVVTEAAADPTLAGCTILAAGHLANGFAMALARNLGGSAAGYVTAGLLGVERLMQTDNQGEP